MKDLEFSRIAAMEAGAVNSEGGFVLLDGPEGIAITLTSQAATEMGMNLIEAAKIAEEQSVNVHSLT